MAAAMAMIGSPGMASAWDFATTAGNEPPAKRKAKTSHKQQRRKVLKAKKSRR